MSFATATRVVIAPATPSGSTSRACGCECVAGTRIPAFKRRGGQISAEAFGTRRVGSLGKSPSLLTRMSSSRETNDTPELDRAMFAAVTGLFSPVVLPSESTPTSSRGPACLLDVADGVVLPGERVEEQGEGLFAIMKDEGWGLSTGALAAVLAVAGCGRSGAFGDWISFIKHDTVTAVTAVTAKEGLTRGVETKRLENAYADTLLKRAKPENVVCSRWFVGSINAIG